MSKGGDTWAGAPGLSDRLATLWGEGLSTAEIGRRMGLTKNQIVGKAHRLNLPARSSPIKHGSEPRKPPGPQRVHGPTLPPLATLAGGVAIRGASPPPQPMPPPRAFTGSPKACCWPIGEPGSKEFRFCDGTAIQGKPYCLDHCQIAYVKPASRQEGIGP